MESPYYTCICMLLLVKVDLADQGDIYDSPIVKPSCTELENEDEYCLPSSNRNRAVTCGNDFNDLSCQCVTTAQEAIDVMMEPVDNRPSSFYLSLRKPPVKTSDFSNGIPKDEGRTDAPGQGNQSGWISSVCWQDVFFGWPGCFIVVALLYGLGKIFQKLSVHKQHVDYGTFEGQRLIEEVSALDVVVENPLDNDQQDEDETILKTKYGDESNSVGPGLEWGSLLYETVPKTKYGDESNSVGSGLDWESIISN